MGYSTAATTPPPPSIERLLDVRVDWDWLAGIIEPRPLYSCTSFSICLSTRSLGFLTVGLVVRRNGPAMMMTAFHLCRVVVVGRLGGDKVRRIANLTPNGYSSIKLKLICDNSPVGLWAMGGGRSSSNDKELNIIIAWSMNCSCTLFAYNSIECVIVFYGHFSPRHHHRCRCMRPIIFHFSSSTNCDWLPELNWALSSSFFWRRRRRLTIMSSQ